MQLLNFKRVGFGYPGQALILSGADFSLEQGERAIVFGSNGSGKSTVALLAARLLVPSNGVVEYHNTLKRHLRVGLVLQNSRAQIIGATVEEDLAFGLTTLNESTTEIHRKVAHFLDLFQLTAKRHLNCERLSGGELRRLALAAVLITEPDLLILDEPLAMLDSYDQAVFLYCLQHYVSKDTTVLWFDHDLRQIRYSETYYGLLTRQLLPLDRKQLNDRAFLIQAGWEPAPLQFLEWQFPRRVSQAILGPEQVKFHDNPS
jgi:energy-coupling factor transporter ATP-binding protein EcfA2